MTLILGAALVSLAVVIFIIQPIVRGLHASLEREEDELTDTEARKRVALLALRDIEYDFLAGKLGEEDYRALKSELTAEAMAALEAAEAEKGRTRTAEASGGDELEQEIARIRDFLKRGLVCGGCGYANEEGSRFCSSCGSALDGRAAS